MEKKVKRYLEFCGVNTIAIIALAGKAMKRLHSEGYEYVNKKQGFKENIKTIVMLLTPIINIIVTSEFLAMNVNDKVYEYVKIELLKAGIIKPTKKVFDKYNKMNLSFEKYEEEKKLELILLEQGYIQYVNGRREWVDENKEKNKVKQIEKYHRNYIQIR